MHENQVLENAKARHSDYVLAGHWVFGTGLAWEYRPETLLELGMYGEGGLAMINGRI